MSPRTGRPTNERKGHRESFRLSDSDIEKLNYCVSHANMTKTDAIRFGIDKVYKEIRATEALDK